MARAGKAVAMRGKFGATKDKLAVEAAGGHTGERNSGPPQNPSATGSEQVPSSGTFTGNHELQAPPFSHSNLQARGAAAGFGSSLLAASTPRYSAPESPTMCSKLVDNFEFHFVEPRVLTQMEITRPVWQT